MLCVCVSLALPERVLIIDLLYDNDYVVAVAEWHSQPSYARLTVNLLANEVIDLTLDRGDLSF